MAMTTSKYGVTAKDLICESNKFLRSDHWALLMQDINDKNQVATISRRLLDPRRPTGKPSSADKEEMLIPYDASLPLNSRSILSHAYQVFGASHLTSSPALVESTSLLLVYGLDLFFTRAVNPSGTFDILTDSFNKSQLLVTLMVLTGGIAVAKPAVQRKLLKAKWFA